jgi:hypothetical protein
VLSLTECVAPAGKTICQEQQLEIEFLSQQQCELAREQLVALKSQSETVIIDPDKASCLVSARRHEVFDSLAAVDAASKNLEGWRLPEEPEKAADFIRVSHDKRLDTLEDCDQTGGEAPCKIGEIIIEAGSVIDSKPVEIWRRDN